MTDTEDTYRGIAYYFSVTPPLLWQVNGVQSASTQDITVRSSGNGQGTALLDFSAADSDTTQSVDSTLTVNFGQAQQQAYLGL